MTLSQSSSVISATGVNRGPTMPALFTAQSRRPNLSTADLTMRSTSSARLTSAGTKCASLPSAMIRCTTCSLCSTRLAAMTTLAPSRANFSAVASPSPELPPVTSATLPANIFKGLSPSSVHTYSAKFPHLCASCSSSNIPPANRWACSTPCCAGTASASATSIFRASPSCSRTSAATTASIVLGGPMNVDQADRFPHLTTEIAAIQEALERDIPILGICLGAQLLAAALGANVRPHNVREIGWYRLHPTAAAQSRPALPPLRRQPARVPVACLHLRSAARRRASGQHAHLPQPGVSLSAIARMGCSFISRRTSI